MSVPCLVTYLEFIFLEIRPMKGQHLDSCNDAFHTEIMNRQQLLDHLELSGLVEVLCSSKCVATPTTGTHQCAIQLPQPAKVGPSMKHNAIPLKNSARWPSEHIPFQSSRPTESFSSSMQSVEFCDPFISPSNPLTISSKETIRDPASTEHPNTLS